MSGDENGNSPNDSGLGFVFGAFSDEFENIDTNFKMVKKVVTSLDLRVEALDLALAYSIKSLDERYMIKNEDILKVLRAENDKKIRSLRLVTYTVLSSIVFVNILFMFYILKGV